MLSMARWLRNPNDQICATHHLQLGLGDPKVQQLGANHTFDLGLRWLYCDWRRDAASLL